MKQISAAMLLLCLIVTVSAQAQRITLQGKTMEIINDSAVPVPMLTVVLKTTDSVFVKGVTADAEGKFRLNEISTGSYILTVSGVGYNTYFRNIPKLTSDTDLGNFIITPSSKMLKEVLVEGTGVVQKVDRTVFMPTSEQLKKSTDSYDLLRNMTIPRLQVDNIMKTLSMNGGLGVQTRINNVKASPTDLSSLAAKDILRVEYIEDPGNRYGSENLGAVINIITRERMTGGQAMVQLNNSVNRIWGENLVAGKYNYKKSQWGLMFDNKYGVYKHERTDATETFTLQNKTIERIKKGIDDKLAVLPYNDISLGYNYIDPDKQVFSVTMKHNISALPYSYASNKMYTKNHPDTLFSKTFSKYLNYSPSLDVYYQRNLPHGNSVEFNVVGTYIRSNNERNYKEFTDIQHPLTDITSNVTGNRYSIIGEGIYDKTFRPFVLSVGVRHIQGSTNNRYTGSKATLSEMWQAETNVFTEIKGKIKLLNYTVGIGVTRSWFKDTNNDKDFYTLRPNLKLGYPINKYSYVHYSFNAYPSVPPLSALTDVEIAVDTIQLKRGNPQLKMYNTYSNNLSYSYNFKKLSFSISGAHRYSVSPIMEDIFGEGNKIIITQANHRFFRVASADMSVGLGGINVGALKDFFSINIYATYNNYHSGGNHYEHHFDNLYYSISPTFYHNGYFGGVQWRKFRSTLYGETINKGENSFYMYAGYRKKNLNIMAIVVEPFNNNYKTGYERLTSVAKVESWNYLKEAGQMVMLKVSYMLEFGKQLKEREKKLKNQDTDTGILK